MRIGKACQLLILLILHTVGNCCHQTNRRFGLEDDDAGKHTKLRVKFLVCVQLNSQVLDLIQRK